MIARDNENRYVGIQCDECAEPAPSSADVLAGHGLNRMGWYCSGGVHICPNHPHPERYVPPAYNTNRREN